MSDLDDIFQTCDRHGRTVVGDCPECILEQEGPVDVMELDLRTIDGETFVKVADVVRFFQDGGDAFDDGARVIAGEFCSVLAAHFSTMIGVVYADGPT